MKIIHKTTGETLFDCTGFKTIKEAVAIAAFKIISLRGADLSNTDLSGINFRNVEFRGADLSNTDLSNCNFRASDLSGANLSGAIISEKIEPMNNIKALIYKEISQKGNALQMESWHTCDTVHCIAGWAVVIHPQGLQLERKYGTNAAAALIFNACGVNPVPDFYTSNEKAMEWLKNGN